MQNYTKIQALRIALESVQTWHLSLSGEPSTRRRLRDLSADWSRLSAPLLLDRVCEALPLIETDEPWTKTRRDAVRLLLVEALEMDDFSEGADLSALDAPFVGEALVVEEGWDGWRVQHVQSFDRDEDGIPLLGSSWPDARERYDLNRTEDEQPLLFEHVEEIAHLGEIDFSSASTAFGPSEEAMKRVVAGVNMAKRMIGRDLTVFAAPLSSSFGAELVGERGDVVWRFYGEPFGIAQVRDVGPLWRGVAAGQLSSIISDAQGCYFVSMVAGKTPHAASDAALSEAVAAFNALRLEAFGDDGWCIALAEVARSEGFGESLKDALRDARCEWAAALAIEDVIRAADREIEAARLWLTYRDAPTFYGQLFAWALKRLRQVVAGESDRRVAIHASRYAWRLARALDLRSEGALRRWLDCDGEDAKRVEVYDDRKIGGGSVGYAVAVWDGSWRGRVDPVEVSAWAVVHGDEIMRTVKHINYLTLYETVLSHGQIRLLDPEGLFWREDKSEPFKGASHV